VAISRYIENRGYRFLILAVLYLRYVSAPTSDTCTDYRKYHRRLSNMETTVRAVV